MVRHEQNPRAAILAAALQRFAQHGYAVTTTRDIMADVGLSPGAYYHHFRCKEEILFEILMKANTETQAELDETLARLANQPADVRLAAAVRHITLRNILRRNEWQLLGSELRSLTPEHRAHIIAIRDRYERQIRELVAEGIRTGLWPPLNIKLFVFNLFAVTNTRWYRPDGPNTPEEIADFNAWYVLRVLGRDFISARAFSFPTAEGLELPEGSS